MRNPPWTDRILSKYWARLEAVVGAAWMPIAASEHKGLREARMMLARAANWKDLPDELATSKAFYRDQVPLLQAQVAKMERARNLGYREYGCGHYGCVMPTQTSGIVIKITTDPTEATFVAAYLSLPQRERPVGIVPYHRIVAIRGESRLKRPVFAIWREEADHVGAIALRGWVRTEAPSGPTIAIRLTRLKI